MPEVPASVTRAIWLLRAVVAWAGLTALLTYVFSDQLVRAWAEGNQTARAILQERGLDHIVGRDPPPLGEGIDPGPEVITTLELTQRLAHALPSRGSPRLRRHSRAPPDSRIL